MTKQCRSMNDGNTVILSGTQRSRRIPQNSSRASSRDSSTSLGMTAVASFLRHSAFVLHDFLIHIPLVALLAFQLLDVFVRLIDALAALLLDNLAQGSIHVLGHAARVTAHEKLRTLGIDPFPDLGRVFRHLVLPIDLLSLIA